MTTEPPVLMLNAPSLTYDQRGKLATDLLAHLTEYAEGDPELGRTGLLDVTDAGMFAGEPQRHIASMRFEGGALDDMDDDLLVEVVRNRIRQTARLLETKLEGHPGWSGTVEVTFTAEAVTVEPAREET